MKKGQAALEFLTTYGWAFLVILIMIGALAYFGVLSPEKFVPQRCNVGPEFLCDEYRAVSTTGVLDIRFKNGIGQTISTVNILSATTSTDEAADVAGDCTVSAGPISAGSTIEVSCPFTAARMKPAGEKQKFIINMNYLPQGKTFEQPITADVYVAVQ